MSVILAVDDNPHNLKLLSGILEHAGYQVRAVGSGARALKLLERELPDLVLLDIDMPELDGYEVCRRLRQIERCAQLPVLFISALDDIAAKLRAFAAGGVDYICKPFEAPEVLARVGAHLGLVTLRRELLARNAELVEINARLTQSHRVLENLAFFDPLTGIANRRHFDAILAREWQRARREALPLALVMIDVDHFKKYNDHYGHAAGDDCLRAVAGAMAGELKRPGDLLARYGGEEFVAVLPDTAGEPALAQAQALRAAVAGLLREHAAAPAGQVTVSVGVALAQAQDNPEAALQRADAALYEAKREGRNRVVLAP